eukprot:10032270-Alexandrium_andersonii.AAC.1
MLGSTCSHSARPVQLARTDFWAVLQAGQTHCQAWRVAALLVHALDLSGAQAPFRARSTEL